MIRETEREFPEVERYELDEPVVYRFQPSRRDFVKILGAGMVIAVSSSRVANAQRRGGRNERSSETIAERFHIAKDGMITVLTSKVEVGQGSRTQLTQAAAEELHIPVDRIQVLMADTHLCPDDGGTAGSRTTPSTVPRVRNAAAAAHQLLRKLAADKLAVGVNAVSFENGKFTTLEGRTLTLAELASDEDFISQLEKPQEEDLTLTAVTNWQVLGTSVAKPTSREIVTGVHEYPSDIRRDGMLYGKILRPTGDNGTLIKIDLEAASQMPGVTVVRDGDFVGCVAATSWQAKQAVEALQQTADWDIPKQVHSDELFEHLRSSANREGNGWPRPRSDEWGDREQAKSRAAKSIRNEYRIPYIAHAPMEPRAAVAEWENAQLTVWTGSQQPSRVQSQLAEAFGISRENVRVIIPDTGGGFGGKHSGEAAIEAARLAKAAGKPVSLRWTREEEFDWAYFRPAGLIEIEAGLDENGKLLAWDMSNYNSGGSALETPYQVPHGRTRFLASESPRRQGSYRALASTANTFARECAMDELAALAGANPLQFRLDALPAGRLKDVLVAAARRFDWESRYKPNASNTESGPKRGVGLACGTEKGSFVAACAEVEVDGDRIRVLEICEAYECGAIQNPSNLVAQVEGAIIMGLGGALFEEIQFRNGQLLNGRFSQYRVPRMRDVPRLVTELVDRQDLPSVGAGETPIIPVAPAIANAVANATGVRLRDLPMRRMPQT